MGVHTASSVAERRCRRARYSVGEQVGRRVPLARPGGGRRALGQTETQSPHRNELPQTEPRAPVTTTELLSPSAITIIITCVRLSHADLVALLRLIIIVIISSVFCLNYRYLDII